MERPSSCYRCVGCALTIHSSRTRFVASRLRPGPRAGRLNSGVSRQIKQRSEADHCRFFAPESWQLATVARSESRESQQLRALVICPRKSSAFVSKAADFLMRCSWVLRIGIWRSTARACQSAPAAACWAKAAAVCRFLAVGRLTIRSSRNRFVAAMLHTASWAVRLNSRC
jgi:hypothetical protein